MSVYYKGLLLGFFEEYWMNNAFMQGLEYKPPAQNQMNKILLDEIYIYTKDKFETILKENFLLNIISNESDNVKNEQILNMTVFIKYHYAFYTFSEFAEDKRLDAAKNACLILAKMLELTVGNLGKIQSITTDTCSLERAILDRLSQDLLCLSHIFYILCNFYGLQLLIKDLLSTSKIKAPFYKSLTIV